MSTIFLINTVLGLFGSCVWFLTTGGSYTLTYTVVYVSTSKVHGDFGALLGFGQ